MPGTRFRRLAWSAVVIFFFGVLLAAVSMWWWQQGPTASDFDELREPRVTRLPDQRMLVVDAAGDPNVVGAQAFKTLFSAYYQLSGVARMSRPPAPRARWPRPLNTPKAQWLGRYALPVADDAARPHGAAPGARLDTWAYGDVAEVLHVGPYSTEEPDIARLHAFIDAKGLRIVGDHEEEYVRGPGMVFAGDAEQYLTIIRLRVEQAPRDTPEKAGGGD